MAEAEQQQAEATELGSRLEDVDTKVDQLTAARTRKYTPHTTITSKNLLWPVST